MKRQVTNLPWLKWFSKNLYNKEIPMLRLGNITILKKLILSLLLASFTACAASGITTDFHDPEMDFGALRTVAVMPFENLARDKLAGERVRDTFANSLLATGAVYVIPTGEVARGVARAALLNPAAPSLEEIVKLAGIIKVDAVITGVIREYGEVRSGAASANIISVSLQMIEIQTRKVVWTASSSKGGISIWDRLFGSGGEPMNAITGAAVNELLDKLFN
jgi:hypothetical protein